MRHDGLNRGRVGAWAAGAAFLAAGCGAPRADLDVGAGAGFFVPAEGRIVDLSVAQGGITTTVTAPSALEGSSPAGRTVAALEPRQLIGPLVVLDLRARAEQAPDLAIEVADLADHERRQGPIPTGSIVALLTGGTRREPRPDGSVARRHPGFSPSAAEFLMRERGALALGSDAGSIDPGARAEPAAEPVVLARGGFVLTGLSALDQVPDGVALAFVGAPRVDAASSPVRVLALVPRRVGRD